MAILKTSSSSPSSPSSAWIEAKDMLAQQQNYQQHSTVPPQLRQLTSEYDEMSGSISTIRVAIVGGGVTGAAILRGLLRYPHIAVDMYESRPTFKEDGPCLELGPAAQEILGALDPALHSCLDRAGAVYCSTDYRIATGPLAGQQIDVDGPQGRITRTVSRQALLAELLAGVPPRMMHPNTRITSVVEASPGSGLALVFSDGTQKRYDVVIGADGSHGKTRAHIIGSDDPAQRPRSSGLWTLPIKVPLERAQMMMGPEALDPSNPRRVCFIGDGTNMQYDFLDNGRDVQVITAAAYDSSGEEFSWARLFSPREFEQIFSQNIMQECQGMVKLVQSVYTIQIAGICQVQHIPTRTYATKKACLVGDAAHGLLPFQGAYAGVTMEEALVLSRLLGRAAASRGCIAAALAAYDAVCRPRAERVVRASFDAALLLTGGAPGIGLSDPARLARALCEKGDVLEHIDVEAHYHEAERVMDAHLAMLRQW